MAAGLSDMSASLKEAGLGSASEANALAWRGATAGVARPGGSSGSRGWPLCGRQEGDRHEEGLAATARPRAISSSALAR